jgi:hypothetical protein
MPFIIISGKNIDFLAYRCYYPDQPLLYPSRVANKRREAMKIASLSFTIAGLLGGLLALLTALGVVPGFVDFGIGLGDLGLDAGKDVITTAFWGGLSIVCLLAGISFGIITEK